MVEIVKEKENGMPLRIYGVFKKDYLEFIAECVKIYQWSPYDEYGSFVYEED